MGEPDEATLLFRSMAGRLMGFLAASGVDRGDVEDVIQDTFLVVHRKGDEVTSHPNPTAYVYKIARGIARDHYRRRVARTTNDTRWHQQHAASTVVTAELSLLVSGAVDVHRALTSLTMRQREVVYLHRCADMTVRDVAEIMGLSQGAVKAHLDRGERRLRELLRDDEAVGRA